MQYRIQTNCNNIDWEKVRDIMREAGLKAHPVEITKKAFENSYCAIFVFEGDLLVGVGRAISDGAYEAAVYDIAVLPEYQGRKIGKLIMDEIHKALGDISPILYARVGREGFYWKLGYRKLLTGMGRFSDEARKREIGLIE